MRPIIYLAHPITGLTPDDVINYYETFGGVIRDIGYDILQPMTGKAYLRTEKTFKASGYTLPQSTNHAIFERDMWMVAKADIVLADFTGATAVSIGTVSELAVAAYLRKHTIAVMHEGNPHHHAFLLEAADIVFPSIKEAFAYLEKFARQET